jgi:nucleoside-diphosphate-sugar epimerase
MTRALVTGASGYVGGRLCAALAAGGWEVHALARAHDDRTREAAVRAARAEVLFHLAADASADDAPGAAARIVDANLRFATLAVDAFAASGGRAVVHAGSFWEFGEDGAGPPNSLYAATKLAFRIVLGRYAARGLAAASLTLFDVYGPSDPRPKLLPRLLAAWRRGETFALSPGGQIVDLVHVDDVAAAFVVAARALAATGTDGTLQDWRVGGGDRRTLREVVDALGRLAGGAAPVAFGALPYGKTTIHRPIAATPPPPGWRARIALDEGLRSLLDEAGIGDARRRA